MSTSGAVTYAYATSTERTLCWQSRSKN
jgi:hypothetical protein